MWSYGSSIPIDSKIKGKLTLPHGLYGIFISRNAQIGTNVTILHHVTIGSVLDENSKLYGYPKIGDNVYIGAGAKVIGNVNIGSGARIGANCVVHVDVPPNCTIVAHAARIIENAK
ncbi:hypothetical protein BCT68_07865 [Vibrio breoganii]|nr:hypothetical protein BCT68_07865 [Vibrio breoganii]